MTNTAISAVPSSSTSQQQMPDDSTSAQSSESSNLVDIKSKLQSLQLRASNRDSVLTTILSISYDVYNTVNRATDEDKASYLKTINSMIEKSDIATNPRRLHTKIIGLVFNKSDMDRRQASTYGNVLVNASIDKVKVSDFELWLKEEGGITKASRKHSEPPNGTPLGIEEILESLSDEDPIETLPTEKLEDAIECDNQFFVALCKWDRSTSELSIYKIDESDARIKNFVQSFTPEFMKEKEEKEYEVFQEKLSEKILGLAAKGRQK